MSSKLTVPDEHYLKHCIALSRYVRERGKHPFAALVVGPDGQIIAEAGNDVPPPGDPTRHAELVVASMAAKRVSVAELARCTLYSSAEPCVMCAGAIYWCGIGRVVYALSERRLLSLTGNHAENPTLSLPCREVFAKGQRSIAVIGPCLEDEAADVHSGFWQ